MADAPKLPSFTHSFYVEFKDPNTGKTLAGDFSIKRLTLAEVGRMGAEVARLNGGQQVDSTTDALHAMIAQCKMSITSAPNWWDPENVYELALLEKVFGEVLKFERSFRSSASEPSNVPAGGEGA
jgi:hypothetical protein